MAKRINKSAYALNFTKKVIGFLVKKNIYIKDFEVLQVYKTLFQYLNIFIMFEYFLIIFGLRAVDGKGFLDSRNLNVT